MWKRDSDRRMDEREILRQVDNFPPRMNVTMVDQVPALVQQYLEERSAEEVNHIQRSTSRKRLHEDSFQVQLAITEDVLQGNRVGGINNFRDEPSCSYKRRAVSESEIKVEVKKSLGTVTESAKNKVQPNISSQVAQSTMQTQRIPERIPLNVSSQKVRDEAHSVKMITLATKPLKAKKKKKKKRKKRLEGSPLGPIKYGRIFGNLEIIPTDPNVDPPFRACFNCWQKDHQLMFCPGPMNQFCENCGRRNVAMSECPRCEKVYYEEMMRLEEKAYEDYDVQGFQFYQKRHEEAGTSKRVVAPSLKITVPFSKVPKGSAARDPPIMKIPEETAILSISPPVSKASSSRLGMVCSPKKSLLQGLRELEKLLEGLPSESIKEAKIKFIRNYQ